MPNNKVVLVTVGSRGIGAQTAKLFAEHGYAVCINYRQDVKAARDVEQYIHDLGGNCILVQGDIAKEEDVVRLFRETKQKLGPISVLVNNAAILHQQGKITELSAARIEKTFNVNVTGSFLCCIEAVKHMAYSYQGDGGVIINVSSMAALSGSANEYIDYAASKGAIDTLTKGLAKEMAHEGIRVNGVRPGLIYTQMHKDGGEANRVDRLKSKIPLGRGGQPREVAQAIYWLASDAASFTTGSFIDVSGGL
ncbi:glucose 1-dehydrogenase [Paraglaciecola chathamensis]|uniref:glucose 1-dehydrogenase n=1 Tax=Paraglaciecola chathamensis TaxID=368405 RepID=UPI00270D2018|nr:glucose 1-dehydrogenase [Paraglaciecola chathamensis]MDO6840563.1 glucose 1-dehydrogenase [Paraglaciecola chathamensis]